MTDLADRVALVTGASGGIGAATAKALASAGATVVVAARAAASLDAVAAEIEAGGGQALAVPADVTDEAAVARLLSTATEAFGRLDCAVNSAGGGGSGMASVAEASSSDFDAAIALDVRGAFLTMKHEIAVMLESGGGAIVNISSRAGLRAPAPGTAPYTAAKHALQGLTKVAALEYAARGVRVNAIAPGPIDTPLLARGGQEASEWAARMVPMGRVGRPEEVAAAAVWLCSDAASFVTGATLEVDGGLAAT